MQTRLGRIPLHDAIPTLAPGLRGIDGAFSSPSRVRPIRRWHSCRLLRPRACGKSNGRFRRPPRSVPRRLVKGVRISDRECLSSSVATRTALEPGSSTEAAKRSIRFGAHVMRIAIPSRTTLRFLRTHPSAYAPSEDRGQAPVHARSNSHPGFRPVSLPTARFSEPEGVLPTSAMRAMHGHHHVLLRFPVLHRKVTSLSVPSPLRFPHERALRLSPSRSRVGSLWADEPCG